MHLLHTCIKIIVDMINSFSLLLYMYMPCKNSKLYFILHLVCNNNNSNDKICSVHISTLLGAQGENPETLGQAPSLSQ